MSAFRPVADISLPPISGRVQLASMIDLLSRRAPSVVVFTLCASILSAWVEAPLWFPTTLAVVVGGLALLLFVARTGRHALRSKEDLGFTQNRSWLAWELAGKGTPPGSYLLAFFGFLTIALIGFQSHHAKPAWAGIALGIVWGIANRRYPEDEGGEV